jgi:hypothetical protein
VELERRGRAALERVGVAAELDVLTDGWFGARVERLPLPRVERRDPGPENRAPPQPASKSNHTRLPPVRPGERSLARLGLDAEAASATPASPCLPKLATQSPTSCGVSMR